MALKELIDRLNEISDDNPMSWYKKLKKYVKGFPLKHTKNQVYRIGFILFY